MEQKPTLDLHDGRLDPRRFKNADQVCHAAVRQSDRPAFTLINKVFHGLRGLEEGHAMVVNYISVFIPWILIIPWFECEWGVNEYKDRDNPIPACPYSPGMLVERAPAGDWNSKVLS